MRSIRSVRAPRPGSVPGGFTLIEFMFALAVLGFGLMALWTLHSSAIASNANAYRLGISTTLAQDAMEQLYAETWVLGYLNPALDTTTCGGTGFPSTDADGLDTLPCSVDGVALSSGTFPRVNGLGNTDATLGPVIFLRSYHVEAIPPGSADRLLIRVRVTYGDPQTGKRHGVTLGATRMTDTYDPLDLG